MGDRKWLTRTRFAADLGIHYHELAEKGRVLPWTQIVKKGLHCHHYQFQSVEKIYMKFKKNNAPWYQSFLQSDVDLFGDEGWYNTVKDDSIVSVWEKLKKRIARSSDFQEHATR